MKNRLAGTIVGLLIVQFILGMLANLYADIPKNQPYHVFEQFGYIALHAMNALVLVILAIVFLVKSLRAGRNHISARVGMGGVLLAYVSGVTFVFTQNDIFSLSMAIGFIIAFTSYTYIYFSSQSLRPSSHK